MLFAETELPSMLSAADFRVRTSHLLESGLALKVHDLVSGASMPESLGRFDRGSSSLRTSQACFLSGWAEFSETFPRSGTMRRGIVSQLVPLAPLTDAIGSGLLPTPCAADTGRTEFNALNRKAAGLQVDLSTWVMLPTPSATSYGSNQGGAAGRVGPVRHGLESMARHGLWPTPTSSLGTKGGRVTPRKGREGGTLIEALSARHFATPTTRDWRSGKASPETMAKNSRPLSEQIGGSLNPTFVEWLMGFPRDWTEK